LIRVLCAKTIHYLEPGQGIKKGLSSIFNCSSEKYIHEKGERRVKVKNAWKKKKEISQPACP
jgi:hypothetical protein